MRKTGWMMMAVAAALLSASPVAAETQPYGLDSTPATTAPSAPAATAVATNTPDPAADQIVCKSLGPSTGTRLGSRHICQTAREWEDQQKAHQRDVLHEQTRGGYFQTPAD
ncbi:MAG TPA: hypothetical protein VII56_07665 [Rhizomicrobium sp.]